MPLLGCHTKPLDRLHVALIDAPAVAPHQPQFVLGGCVSVFGQLAKLRERGFVVRSVIGVFGCLPISRLRRERK